MSLGVVSITLRVAACTAAMWGAWQLFGTSGLVFVAPLFGVAFARPLIELAASALRAMRHANWRDVEGRHYAYRGRSVTVIADADGQRWIRLADIRAIVGFTASDGALFIAYPDGTCRAGRPPEPYIGAEALLVHLGKERAPESLRLKIWVERAVAFPVRRDRTRPTMFASEDKRQAKD